MQELISAMDLQKQWKWTDPVINIESEYRTHKALILASVTEGLPNVVCEAMSCGLPCIVSNVLDHPRLVEDGVSGFLFDPSSHIELCNSIKKLIDLTQSQYDEMCTIAANKGKSLFSKNDILNKYLELC